MQIKAAYVLRLYVEFRKEYYVLLMMDTLRHGIWGFVNITATENSNPTRVLNM